MPGNDDVVRVVEVRTRSGTYTRPVSELYKLEDNGNSTVSDGSDVRQGEE